MYLYLVVPKLSIGHFHELNNTAVRGEEFVERCNNLAGTQDISIVIFLLFAE